MSIESSTLTPPQSLQNQPIMHWSREDTLKYAEYIKKAMSGWEASNHISPISGLLISTTPSPNATIQIIDTVTKEILYKN